MANFPPCVPPPNSYNLAVLPHTIPTQLNYLHLIKARALFYPSLGHSHTGVQLIKCPCASELLLGVHFSLPDPQAGSICQSPDLVEENQGIYFLKMMQR